MTALSPPEEVVPEYQSSIQRIKLENKEVAKAGPTLGTVQEGKEFTLLHRTPVGG